MTKRKIGVIGAGIMASGMVQNFLKHGYEVAVWNRSPEHLETLIQAGATRLETPKAVTQSSDILIECVSDDDASRGVWLGDDGILAGATAQKVLVTSASLSLDWTDELAKLCADKGFQFLDMPLTGSRAGAEGGTLRLLVGGNEKVLDSIRPELAAIAEKIYHFGPAGSGMRFKLVLNILIGIHTNAAAQTAELARAAGLDVSKVHFALFDGKMGPSSPTTDMLFKNMDTPADQVNFAVKWIEKDLRYAKVMAEQLGIDFDLLNDTQADFARAISAGLADQDQTKIIKLYKDKP